MHATTGRLDVRERVVGKAGRQQDPNFTLSHTARKFPLGLPVTPIESCTSRVCVRASEIRTKRIRTPPFLLHATAASVVHTTSVRKWCNGQRFSTCCINRRRRRRGIVIQCSSRQDLRFSLFFFFLYCEQIHTQTGKFCQLNRKNTPATSASRRHRRSHELTSKTNESYARKRPRPSYMRFSIMFSGSAFRFRRYRWRRRWWRSSRYN